MEEKKRKHNKNWKDATRTERSNERLKRLRSILAAAGWKSESELHTAIINGLVTVPEKPKGGE